MTQGEDEVTSMVTPEEIDETARALDADTNRLLDSLPMEFRPLANVPGRNRKEKRTYRKLATLAERGTIRKHAALRLKRLYVELVRAGKIKK